MVVIDSLLPRLSTPHATRSALKLNPMLISVLPGQASRPGPGPACLRLAQLGPSLLYISLKLGLGLHTLQA